VDKGLTGLAGPPRRGDGTPAPEDSHVTWAFWDDYLSRPGELTDEVITIASSGSWRRHRTAFGAGEWRDASSITSYRSMSNRISRCPSRIRTYAPGSGGGLADRSCQRKRAVDRIAGAHWGRGDALMGPLADRTLTAIIGRPQALPG
jgi:hypothetical protein